MAMEKRKLGRSTIEIPPLVLGGNVFGWTVDEAMSLKLLDAAVDAGLNAIDTADVYSAWAPGHQGGESETVIGRWLKRRGGRSQVIIATKVGMKMGSGGQGLSQKWIVESVDNSLKRLQTDYIDLYQAHQDDPDTPLEETLSAFARLIEQGKVRAIGASNYKAARLTDALQVSERLGLPRYESLQPRYNLIDREEFEKELAPVCRAAGIGVISFYGLAAGFLTGKYRSDADLPKSARGQGVKARYYSERNFQILDAVEAIARTLGVTPGQLAIAWLIAKPDVTAPIASVTTLAQLEELIGAIRLKLKPETVDALDRAGTLPPTRP
jgi:aryl-alcohol dehydrogenase-like predicted oxidoreductase